MREQERKRDAATGAAQSLGAYLRSRRTERRLTLREVEEASGISNPYLSQLETGKITRPSPHILHKLSVVYGVPYEVLMEKAGYIAPSNPGRPPSGPPTSGHRIPASAFEDITPEEEEALRAYLEFLRFKRTRE